jgi:hypothetical protein
MFLELWMFPLGTKDNNREGVAPLVKKVGKFNVNRAPEESYTVSAGSMASIVL